jgi:hypothetical protein
MNSQFSIIYTIIFLAVIAGSFAALKAMIHHWADYQVFLQESYLAVSAMNLADYFDSYSVMINLSGNISAKTADERFFFNRSGFFNEFDSNGFKDVEFFGSNLLIEKNGEGVGII